MNEEQHVLPATLEAAHAEIIWLRGLLAAHEGLEEANEEFVSALVALDVDSLSPLEALTKLYELKRIARGK